MSAACMIAAVVTAAAAAAAAPLSFRHLTTIEMFTLYS